MYKYRTKIEEQNVLKKTFTKGSTSYVHSKSFFMPSLNVKKMLVMKDKGEDNSNERRKKKLGNLKDIRRMEA